MDTLTGLLSPGFSFPDTLDMPQTTVIPGCRPWSATIPPFPPQSPSTQLRGVTAVSANDVWAVGFSAQPPDEDAPILTLIEHWDGKSWQIIPSPNPNPEGDNALFRVAAVNANDVWAVGFSGATPGARGFTTGQTLIEHWDGTGWQVIPSPSLESVGNSLQAVAVVGTNDVWAAGFTGNTASGPLSTLIEHWDGKTWRVVQSPNPASAINQLHDVAVVSTHDIWAVGVASNTFFSSNHFTTTLVEHWDGHRWRVVASPSPGWGSNILLAVAAVSAHNVWAVGSYSSNLPEALQGQTLVEHWNGQAWQLIPSESPGLLFSALSGIVRVPVTQTLWVVGQKADTVQVVQPLAEFSC